MEAATLGSGEPEKMEQKPQTCKQGVSGKDDDWETYGERVNEAGFSGCRSTDWLRIALGVDG